MIKFFDGGMGSMLNLAAGELPEKLNISDPERVFAVLMQKQVRSLLLQTPLAQIHLNMIMLMNL